MSLQQLAGVNLHRPGWPMMVRLLIIVIGAGVMSGCGINNLPTYDEQVKSSWAQVQNQYQRRWADY